MIGSCGTAPVSAMEENTVRNVNMRLDASIANKLMVDLRLELATFQAKQEAQQSITTELRTYMGLRDEASGNGSSPT